MSKTRTSHARTCTHTQTHINTHKHTYTHTHACKQALKQEKTSTHTGLRMHAQAFHKHYEALKTQYEHNATQSTIDFTHLRVHTVSSVPHPQQLFYLALYSYHLHLGTLRASENPWQLIVSTLSSSPCSENVVLSMLSLAPYLE